MIFTATKTDLNAAVSIASRAVPGHSTMTILQCLLIRADHNNLTLTGNDTELGIETVIPANVQENGVIAVEVRLFSEICRKLPEETVFVSTDRNNVITIKCGRAKFSIPGRDGDEFSTLPAVELEHSINMSQAVLKQMILQTIFSVATKDSIKIMTGECFEINGSILRIISLDGHRISMRKTVLEEECSMNDRIIIPGKTLTEVSRILSGDKDENVTIIFAKNHAIFQLENTRVVTRLIDGDYFNIDQMISPDYETKLTVSKDIIMNCVERSTLFVKENEKKPIIFDIEDTELNLFIDSSLGSFSETLEVETEGRNLAIGFNPRFVLDALKVIDDEVISLYLVNAKAPCFIRSEDYSYMYVVLPVNFLR